MATVQSWSLVLDHFVEFDIERLRTHHHFLNKMWQVSRFVIMHINKHGVGEGKKLNLMDKWMLHQTAEFIQQSNAALQDYNLNAYVDYVENFWIRHFCDVYVVSILCSKF